MPEMFTDKEKGEITNDLEELNELNKEISFEAFSSYASAPKVLEESKRHIGRPLGFSTLDFLLQGVSSGELITVSAPTGVGKTTLLQSITWQLAQQGVPALWYSLENSLENFIQPFIKNDPGATWDSTGKLLKVSGLPIYWPKNVEKLDFETLKKAIRYANLTLGVEHVYLDHLHHLITAKEMMSTKSISLFIGDKLRQLRAIGLETGVSIFLVAHIGKTVDGARPSINDLRDCLPKGQKVYSGGKYILVENLKKGDRVVSLRKINSLQEDVVTDVWPVGKKTVLRITTKTGRTIDCSDGHKFYAMTKGSGAFGHSQKRGIQGWTEAKHLMIGQKIAVVRSYPEGESMDILTQDQSIVLGWLVGDGHTTNKGYSEITTCDESDAKVIQKLATSWGLCPTIRPYPDKNAWRVFMSHSKKGKKTNLLAKYLREKKHLFIGKDKRVPEDIFVSSPLVVASFLRGLFHADGSVSVSGINSLTVSFCSVSEQLAREVHCLLLRCNIISFLRKKETINGFSGLPHTMWEVFIYGDNIYEFCERIGFLGNKQEKLLRLVNKWKARSSRKKQDTFFDRIVSIETLGEKDCFDVSVRGHHASLQNNSFCVNDFITHNSSFVGQESDAVIMLYREKLANPIMKKVDGFDTEVTHSSIVIGTVEKSRRTGQKGVFYLQWNKGLYTEIPRDQARFLLDEERAISKG